MEKTIGQKIAYGFAILCYALGAACALGAVFYQGESTNDPIKASLMASTIFFGGAGIVLHVIATARLKGILSEGLDRDEDGSKRD